MKTLHQILFLAALAAAGGQATAATLVTGATVAYVGTYGSGELFVGLNKNIAEPGCPAARFDVVGTHSQIANWLSVALEARRLNKTITVRTNGCQTGYPTLDNTTGTYFHIVY